MKDIKFEIKFAKFFLKHLSIKQLMNCYTAHDEVVSPRTADRIPKHRGHQIIPFRMRGECEQPRLVITFHHSSSSGIHSVTTLYTRVAEQSQFR